jgi:hypothetical protein
MKGIMAGESLEKKAIIGSPCIENYHPDFATPG